jgi:hypothetical protein
MFYLDRDVTWDYQLLWLQVVATGGQGQRSGEETSCPFVERPFPTPRCPSPAEPPASQHRDTASVHLTNVTL